MKFVPRSEATRQFILETCAPVFNQKGLAGTSIADLEKATKLTKGSIYGNFENKDAVALAVFDFNLNNKFTLIKQWEDQGKTFREKLLAHIRIHSPQARAPFIAGGCPMQNTAIEADDTNEMLRKKASEGLLSWKKNLEILILGGISADEFHAETNASATALHIISLIESGAMMAKVTQNMSLADEILTIAEQVVKSISK